MSLLEPSAVCDESLLAYYFATVVEECIQMDLQPAACGKSAAHRVRSKIWRPFIRHMKEQFFFSLQEIRLITSQKQLGTNAKCGVCMSNCKTNAGRLCCLLKPDKNIG